MLPSSFIGFLASRLGPSACAIAFFATASVAEPIKVVVSQKDGWDASVVELGTRAGIFKDQGLDVELLFASGGGEPIQALISGSVDISVSTGFLATLGAIAKGAPLEIVSSAFTGTSDVFWYVPAAPMRIFTTNSLLWIHQYASLVYYPVWVVDRELFEGPEYARLHGCPTF